MSSLLTKVNKSRSPAPRKVLAKKGKKASAKNPQRPGKITVTPRAKRPTQPKAKKVASAPAKKAIAQKAVKAQARKSLPVKAGLKQAVKRSSAPGKASASANRKAVTAKTAKSARSVKITKTAKTAKAARTVKPVKQKGTRRSVAARAAVKASRLLPKPLPPPPKKPPTANALAAVRAFELALKIFNRHGFAEARTAFDSLLEKFPDQAEVTAGARTYLAICEQRLTRAPSVPRDAESLYDQGVFQFNKGNTREAIDLYDKALRADPRADHVWYSLAAAYARQTDPSKALDALRRAIGIRSVHRSHARRDLDFAGLRTNHEFQQLTGFGFDLLDE